MILANEMRERLETMMNGFFGTNNDRIYYSVKNVPPKKLQNAINSYAGNFSQDEELICFIDETAFGSAKEGIIITTKHFYGKSTFDPTRSSICIPIENINVITEKDKKQKNVYWVRIMSDDGKTHYPIFIHIDREGLAAANGVAKFYKDLFDALKGCSDNNSNEEFDEDYESSAAAPPESPVCPQCGTSLEEGEKFCAGCGAKVPKMQEETSQPSTQSNPAPAESSKKACHNCKKDLEAEWSVCPYCNTKVITLTCKKCGKELQEEWLVCPYCNTKKGPKLCAQCGKELQEEWKACPFCSAETVAEG